MAYKKSNQPSIVPDSYLVMVKRPRGGRGGAADAFNAAEAAQKMVSDIRKLAKKHGETVRIEMKNLADAGACKLKCDRYFAGLVGKLPSVGHIAPERVIQPGHKGPKYNL